MPPAAPEPMMMASYLTDSWSMVIAVSEKTSPIGEIAYEI
jgi:hypothetical protein